MGIILAVIISFVVGALATYGYFSYTGSILNVVKPKAPKAA